MTEALEACAAGWKRLDEQRCESMQSDKTFFHESRDEKTPKIMLFYAVFSIKPNKASDIRGTIPKSGRKSV